MSKIWLLSDTHFYHANICRLSGRPWNSVEEMNSGLLENINGMVAAEDHLYFLGDFSFGSKDKFWQCWDQIRCQNIWYILGNHCRPDFIRTTNEVRKRFRVVTKRLEENFVIDGKCYHTHMCHYPPEPEKISDSIIYLWGHRHSKVLQHAKNSFDVGCDSTEYKPISLDTIIDMYENWVPPRPRKGH